MDANILESTLKKLLFNDKLEVYVFNVFEDTVCKYAMVGEGNFTKVGSDSLTNYLENIKTKIGAPYLSGFMNLVSIPKLKEQQDGKMSFKYQALNRKWYKITATLVNLNQTELIFSVREELESSNDTKESADFKYNGLISKLADSILKIDNVFSLDQNKTNIKNVEEYINSVFNGLTISYPELKKSLNSVVANVSARVDEVLLIIDDDAITRNMIKKIFVDEYKIVMASNGKEALEYLESNSNKGVTESSDNVLGIFLDLTMPVMDGFSVLEYLSKNNYLSRIPVIIISGDYEKETKAKVYNYGVADMLEKPFDFQVVKHRIGNFINLYKSSNSLNRLIIDQTKDLKELLNPIIENYLYDYKINIKNIKKYITILANKVSEDYPEYNLDNEIISKMADASMYYDVGFYSVPKMILSKSGNFDNKELKMIKDYPIYGDKMVDYVLSLTNDSLYKKYCKNITKYYHENYDGSGYPNGLKENEIPLEAQIASVCITYNNLINKGKDAKDIIISKSGIMFNPKIVGSFMKVIDEFKQVI